jgi:hypothetical protein
MIKPRINWMGGAYGIQRFSWKPEERRPLGRPNRRQEDNIKMNLKEIGWKSVEWIYLAQDRDKWWAVLNTVI